MTQKDIERMVAAGLVSPEQGSAIREYFRLGESRWWRWVLGCLAVLAGGLIVAGIIMLISANWENIPPLAKMVLAMVLLVVFWVLWYCKHESTPLVAEVYGFCGAGMWLGCIALYGQIFQLQNPFVEGCTLFLAGVLLLPFVSRQRFLIGVVVTVSFVQFLAMGGDDSYLCMKNWISGWRDEYLFYGVPVLWSLWWGLSERWRVADGRWSSYGYLSAVLLVVAVTMGQLMMYIPYVPFNCDMVCVVLMGLVPVILLLFRPHGVRWGFWLLQILVPSLIVPSFQLLSKLHEWTNPEKIPHGGLDVEYVGQEMSTMAGIGIYFVLALVMMFSGVRARRLSWINISSLMIAYAAIALVVDVLDSYTLSGLVLVGIGLLLLGLGTLLEKNRRRLVGAVKKSQHSVMS